MVATGIVISFAFLAFLLSFLGFYIFHIVSKKRVVEHAVRKETEERHAAKKYVPDMAGVVMLFVYACIYPLYIKFIVKDSMYYSDNQILIFYFAPLFLGGIGLLDDMMKRRTKSTRGLRALFRFPMQVIIACFIALALFNTTHSWGSLYFIWVIIFILATINAANFTDGLDGLLTGCAIIAVLGLVKFSVPDIYHYRTNIYGEYILFSDEPVLIFSVLPLSIMVAFLFFNTYPAKMFMGDCGSLFIGSFLALLPIVAKNTYPFIVIGFMIYLALISVVIQVISFKLTKRRIFPMTPFHHSFEKWGWHENHIVWFYYFLSFIFASLAIIYWKKLFNLFFHMIHPDKYVM